MNVYLLREFMTYILLLTYSACMMMMMIKRDTMQQSTLYIPITFDIHIDKFQFHFSVICFNNLFVRRHLIFFLCTKHKSAAPKKKNTLRANKIKSWLDIRMIALTHIFIWMIVFGLNGNGHSLCLSSKWPIVFRDMCVNVSVIS